MDNLDGRIRRNKRRRTERAGDRGFTLVEALVAVMISSILGVVMLTLLKVNNDSVKYGAITAKVRSQYEIALENIGISTRRAYAVLDKKSGEIYSPNATFPAVKTSQIEMDTLAANGTGTAFRYYSAVGGELKEWRPGWSDYKSFTVGKWPTVSVLDTEPFLLSADRKSVTISVRVTGTFGGVTAVAPARREVFMCRNR